MTYQVLARKWRPRSFKEMAGQGHVLKTLINSLDNNRLHHAYLFTGTRGVGKTTIARILAKCLNCETGVRSEPCGECGACREIDEGRFIDLIEVDAASRTKVEDTRELLDNVQYSPSRGRFKVYLIDEVHMLSGHSFNALLKTLEEPPPHVKFLLATTDPQKLPVTVLSRCLQFNLKNLSPEQLFHHLQFVLEQEGIPYEDPALWQIGRAARGSARDALTLLDQAISYCDGNIRDAEVRALLGSIDQAIIHELLDTLVRRDAAAMLTVIDKAAQHAPDFAAVLNSMLSYLHRVAVAQVVPEGIDNSQGDRDSILQHAARISAEDLQLYYQIATQGRQEMPLAVDPRCGLEMTLLRMLAFSPDDVPVQASVPLEAVEDGQEPAANPDDASEVKKKQFKRVNSSAEAVEVNGKLPESGTAATASATPVKPVNGDNAGKELIQAVADACGTPATRVRESSQDGDDHEISEENQESLDLATLEPRHWIALFRSLNVTGITRNIAANCIMSGVGASSITLTLEESQATVYNDEQRSRIQSALREYFDTELELVIETGPITAESPAAYRKRREEERQQQAITAFENDSNVQEILERFSGQIQPGSIVPLTPKPD